MASLQIDIAISAAGVKTIAGAGQCVTLVQSVGSFVDVAAQGAGAETFVAWQVFPPFEHNVVTWSESYFLYVTTTALETGAVLILSSVTAGPAVPGWTYTLSEGTFTGASGAGDTFNVSNQMSSGSLSFGLAQSATVNGSAALAPLNAVPVLFGQGAQFTLPSTVLLFLSSCNAQGTVIPAVPDNALSVSPSPGSPVKVGFDNAANTFLLLSS